MIDGLVVIVLLIVLMAAYVVLQASHKTRHKSNKLINRNIPPLDNHHDKNADAIE